MTTAYWCILAAALMPYLWVMVAKGTPEFKISDNAAPRNYMDNLSGFRQRANWAQINAFETFPFFAAAVIVAQSVGNAEQGMIDTLAMAYIACRLFHGVFYVTNLHPLRTLAWAGGFAISIYLFVISA